MLKNVVSLKLLSNEFPTAVYTFSDKLCSSSFKIITYEVDGLNIVIPATVVRHTRAYSLFLMVHILQMI